MTILLFIKMKVFHRRVPDIRKKLGFWMAIDHGKQWDEKYYMAQCLKFSKGEWKGLYDLLQSTHENNATSQEDYLEYFHKYTGMQLFEPLYCDNIEEYVEACAEYMTTGRSSSLSQILAKMWSRAMKYANTKHSAIALISDVLAMPIRYQPTEEYDIQKYLNCLMNEKSGKPRDLIKYAIEKVLEVIPY